MKQKPDPLVVGTVPPPEEMRPSWSTITFREKAKRSKHRPRLHEVDDRDTLAEYATWCAKVMQDELNLDAEAKEALELKAKLEGK